MEQVLWKIKYLFYRYILRHRYVVGIDLCSRDYDCIVVARINRKGQMFIEKMNNNQ